MPAPGAGLDKPCRGSKGQRPLASLGMESAQIAPVLSRCEMADTSDSDVAIHFAKLACSIMMLQWSAVLPALLHPCLETDSVILNIVHQPRQCSVDQHRLIRETFRKCRPAGVYTLRDRERLTLGFLTGRS